jgi:hypothetical protein
MLFLEDLYASKRSTGLVLHTSPGHQPRVPTRNPPPPPIQTRNVTETLHVPVERHERAPATKRNSIFSRRKSTATTSSSESKRNSSSHSAGATSRRSSLVDMGVVDGESFKNKLFSGFHTGKKPGPRKSDPTADDHSSNAANSGRRAHRRGASADCKKHLVCNDSANGFP